MKKSILFLVTFFCVNSTFSQFLTTGTLTSDNKYRLGGIGIGYSALPSFGTNKFLVNGNSFFNGNVGIGTSLPSSKLHVQNGQLTIGDYFTVWDDTNANVGLKSSKCIVVNTGSSLLSSIDIIGNGQLLQMAISKCNSCYSVNAIPGDAVIRANSSGSLIVTNGLGGDIKFETGNSNINPENSKIRMIIDVNGNVGIGTGSSSINPDDKLAVNGLIHTKEVKVDLVGWPDYVFEKDYNLISLVDLEKKIIENKHLPEIPSAKDVEENGVLLGDMNKKLLQKVEELTLYIIEMNKEIQKLKEKLNN